MRGTGGGCGKGGGFSSATNSPIALGWETPFSRAFSPRSVELHHIMAEHILMVKAPYENVQLVFVFFYA